MKSLVLILAGLTYAVLVVPAEAVETELRILPASVVIHGSNARPGILVEEFVNGRAVKQLSRDIAWSVSRQGIIRIVDEAIMPLANGVTVLTATSRGRSSEIEVRVTGFESPEAPGFRNHVLAIFAKTG